MHLYTTVTAMRDEGVPLTIPDARILERIRYASRSIESWTGRQFYPVRKSLTVDGRDASLLRLGDPIIRIDSVEFLSAVFDYGPEGIALTDIEVYNNHMRGVTEPDDRDDPRLMLSAFGEDWDTRTAAWPLGSQNIRINGVFGYTDPAHADRLSAAGPFALVGGMTLEVVVDDAEDPQVVIIEASDYANPAQATADEVATALSRDVAGAYAQAEGAKVRLFSQRLGVESSIAVVGGSAASALGFPAGVGRYLDGITPPDIVRCCQLMVSRDLARIGRRDERELDLRSRFMTSIRTREQSASFGFPADTGERRSHVFIGNFTGDPEIDSIIARYCKPPQGFWV